MDLNEKRMRLNYLYGEAKKILEDQGSDAKALETADGYLTEAVGLKAEIDQHEDRQKKMSGLNDYMQGAGRQSRPDVKEEPTKAGTHGFKSLGEFLKAARIGRDPRLVWEASIFSDEEKKDLAEAGGASGGFLVPPDYRPTLLQLTEETSVVRPRATVMPMPSRTMTIPVLNQDINITAGDQFSAFLGGVYVEWTEEAAEKPAHEPSFRQLQLTAHKVTAYTRASDELLADSGQALEALITSLMGRACTWSEDYAFLRGDGVAKPLGVLNSGATLALTRNASGNTIEYVDCLNMLVRMLPTARPVWVCGPSALPDIFQFQDANGNYIMHNIATASPAMQILGYPLIVSEKMPEHDQAGGLLLADFSYYLIGDRQAVTVASSTHERFRYDQTAWRVVQRLDGRTWLTAAIELNDATTTVSPFVTLAAA